MEAQYTCAFEIDYKHGDVEINVDGDGQQIRFTFMIAFFSIPTFFYLLLRLWKGKTNKTDIDGFGFAVSYYFTVQENELFIEHKTFDENDQPVTYKYKYDFEKFMKAIDQGFTKYLQEQREKGVLPLKVEEHTHPLSQQVIKEYGEFSAILNEGDNGAQ
ncbi:hypothetical protein ACFOZY_01215 [Chungangia koreensis]|uniref:Uncharacterized protein n=1 Tax=Chungangia koreensis TaxID=752657 RepID=A0ABV8X338_9LACT